MKVVFSNDFIHSQYIILIKQITGTYLEFKILTSFEMSLKNHAFCVNFLNSVTLELKLVKCTEILN